MKSWILALTLASISLTACKRVTVTRPAEQEQAAEQQLITKQRIEELEREIENSTNFISDLEAAVLMERAKVEDNPDYDQSFLLETLSEQQHEREKIERARREIDELMNPDN